MSDPVNRFRFTGGAQIPAMDPVQGTSGMTPEQMQAQAALAQQNMIPGSPGGTDAAKEEWLRMQYGQAAQQPSPEQLAAMEDMAAKELQRDPAFIQQLIQMLGMK